MEISSRRFSLYVLESKNPTAVEMWRLGAIIIITRGITITTRVKILTKLPKKLSLIQIFLVLGLNLFRGWSYTQDPPPPLMFPLAFMVIVLLLLACLALAVQPVSFPLAVTVTPGEVENP